MAQPATRLRIIELALTASLVIVLGRAAQVQLVQGAHWREVAESRRTARVILPARRGTVTDRNGTPLAITFEHYHVGVAPNEIRDAERVARLLRRHLGLSRGEVAAALRKRWAYFHGPYPAAQVDSLRDVSGVHLERELRRFYPSPDFARGVVGRAGDDGVPASGVERMLDSVLQGDPGEAVVLKDRSGRAYDSPSRVRRAPRAGADVALTLDEGLQDIAQRSLATAIRETEADGGDVVMLDPGSGELLAVASRGAAGHAASSAFTSIFEPGSTAKIFTAAALLRHDLVRDTEWVSGENGRWDLGYRVIADVHTEPRFTLGEAIRQSSNIAIAKFAERLEPAQHYVMLRDFGFGTPTGVEVPSESPGRLRPPHEWTSPSAHSLAMGYEVAVTPVQLAAAYGALANDGILMQPTLVLEIREPDGAVRYRHRPHPVRRVVNEAVARRLRAWLRDAVMSGTGVGADLSRYEVAGKTGTTRRVINGRYQPGEYTASFVSLFPADDPQLVVVVKLDSPRREYLAALTAVPLTRAMIQQALAARAVALDRSRFAEADPVQRTPPPDADGAVTHVVRWPPAPDGGAEPAVSVVPAVAGLSLRAAAQELHRHGLRVRIRGRGAVRRTEPAAGSRVASGGIVTVVAGDGR